MLLPVATLVACQPLLIPSGPPVGDLETLDPCQDPTTWFEDVDGDGYGVEDSTFETCGVPEAGWSLRIGDCDDADDGIYPGAIETCDGVDRDCSGRAGDHAIDRVERGIDADGDGHRDADLEPVLVCADTPGTVAPDAGLDCDDGDPTIHEGADDPLCDGIDQSCSGVVSEVARSGDVKFADLELALIDPRFEPGREKVLHEEHRPHDRVGREADGPDLRLDPRLVVEMRNAGLAIRRPDGGVDQVPQAGSQRQLGEPLPLLLFFVDTRFPGVLHREGAPGAVERGPDRRVVVQVALDDLDTQRGQCPRFFTVWVPRHGADAVSVLQQLP